MTPDKPLLLMHLEQLEEKKATKETLTRGQSYKPFYGCNLRIFLIGRSVSHWQASPD
jgi:hypothetical protein